MSEWLGSKVTRDCFPEKGEYIVARVIDPPRSKAWFVLTSDTDPDSPVTVPWDMVTPVWD